jgi:acylphosphatase
VTAARYVVSGRVQGVGFRWFVRSTALELGLRGSVRNLPDGSVEVIAAGPADALEQFERSLRNGPQAASVSGVAASPAPMPRGHGFQIR